MPRGQVKWFNEQKGFGFIIDPETGVDVFVHFSEIRIDGFRTLTEGQTVDYERLLDGKGYKAVNVRLVDGETTPRNVTLAVDGGHTNGFSSAPAPSAKASFAIWDHARRVIAVYPESVKSYLSLLLQSLERSREQHGVDQHFVEIASDAVRRCLDTIETSASPRPSKTTAAPLAVDPPEEEQQEQEEEEQEPSAEADDRLLELQSEFEAVLEELSEVYEELAGVLSGED